MLDPELFSLPIPTGALDPIFLPNEVLLQKFSRRRITWKHVPADPTLRYSNTNTEENDPSSRCAFRYADLPTATQPVLPSSPILTSASTAPTAPVASATAAAAVAASTPLSALSTTSPTGTPRQLSRTRRSSSRFWNLFSKSNPSNPLMVSGSSSDNDLGSEPVGTNATSTVLYPKDSGIGVNTTPTDYSHFYISNPSILGMIYVTSQRIILVPSNSNSMGFYFDISRIMMMEVTTFRDRNDRVYFVCHIDDSSDQRSSSADHHRLFGMSFLTQHRADAFCQLIANIKLIHLIKDNFPPRYTSLNDRPNNMPNLCHHPQNLHIGEDHDTAQEPICSCPSLCSQIISHDSVNYQDSDSLENGLPNSESVSSSMATAVPSVSNSTCANCDGCLSVSPPSSILEDDWDFSDQCLPSYEESELALKKYLISQNLIKDDNSVGNDCLTLDNLFLLARASAMVSHVSPDDYSALTRFVNMSSFNSSRRPRGGNNNNDNNRYCYYSYSNGFSDNGVPFSTGGVPTEPLFDTVAYVLPYSWF